MDNMLKELIQYQNFFIGLAIFIAVLFVRKLIKEFKIWRWNRSLNLNQHQRVFNEIYKNHKGFEISKLARKKMDAPEYVYGEIEFLSFIALLSLTKPNNDTVFYDLGSGTGKAVLAAAMVFPLKKSVGIELFKELFQNAWLHTLQLAKNQDYIRSAEKISFINCDFLKADLQDATLIFINSTALFDPTWTALCSKLESLPHLQTVITTSKQLKSSQFSLERTVLVMMSWGIVRAFINIRKTIVD